MTVEPLNRAQFGKPVRLLFEIAEYEDRQRLIREELSRRGLDGLIVSRIEDQFWLCGLDTSGFTIFHSMFIGVGGQLTHLSRSADLANIAYSSLCDDVRLYDDVHGHTRSEAIWDVLAGHGMANKRIGIELNSFGMLPDLYVELTGTLDGKCVLEDASDLIRNLRMIKSPQELVYMRRAGEVLGKASEAAVRATVPGAEESAIFSAFNEVVMAEDGDLCAEPQFPLGAGERALLVRHATGRGRVSENDQIVFEPGAAFRRYNVANMFTVLTGPAIDEQHLSMHAACVAALADVQASLRPGNTFGDVFATHKKAFADHGYGDSTLRACGYPMGAMWPPTWMEKPVMAEGEPMVLREGMTIFTHMILSDRETGRMMSLGETAAVTAGEPEILSPLPRTPFVTGA